MSLCKRQKDKDKIISQGAPPSTCKQGWDSSACPESRCKYVSSAATLEPGHYPSSRAPVSANKMATQSWNWPIVLSPSSRDNKAKQENLGLSGCCFVNPPYLAPSLPSFTNLCNLLPVLLSLCLAQPPVSENPEPSFSHERRMASPPL